MVTWESLNANAIHGIDGLRVLRSEKFIIIASTDKYRSKILQIILRKDGSIFVDFPFFANTEGMLSLMTYKANTKPPADLSLFDGGKVTSHLVKYSYHPDGNAHFSQDSKIRTEIKKRCPPKNKIEHFFTAYIQGLASYDQFDLPREKTLKPKERTFIEAALKNESPAAIKIVCRIDSRKNILRGRS